MMEEVCSSLKHCVQEQLNKEARIVLCIPLDMNVLGQMCSLLGWEPVVTTTAILKAGPGLEIMTSQRWA